MNPANLRLPRILLYLRIFALAAISWTGSIVCALPEDRDQPIKIQSDRAERDQKTGVTVYSGDVQIEQGTLLINADKVILEIDDDRVKTIVATGRPARMRQRPSLNEEVIHASGETIQYDVEREILTLLVNASVRQEETFVSSERIDYFLNEHRFQARGSASAGEDRERVIMVFPPKQVDEQIQKSKDGETPSTESGEEL